MNKIIITIGVLLIGMITMAYLYFSNLNKSTNANDVSLNAVSANAGLIFSYTNDKSFYEILNGQELFQNILGKTKTDQLKFIKEELIEKLEMNEFLAGQKIYIGFLQGDENTVDFLICTQFKQAPNLPQLLNRYNSKNIKINPLKDIFKLTFSDSISVYVGAKDNLVVLSNASNQVHKAIAAEKPKTSDFAAYIKTNTGRNKNTLASLYVNFDALPAILKNIINGSISGELNVFNEQKTYATLNYNFSSEKILFNGSTQLNNEVSYYKLFDQFPDQKLIINNLLPQKTANYTIYAVSDYKNWYTGLNKWLSAQKGNEKILKNEENISKKYGLDLKQIFHNYFKNQFVTFQLASGERLGGIELTNGEKVGQLLLDLSAEYSPNIRIFREASIPYTYFGEPFKKFEKPYYTIIDNYLVMANNASTIQVFLNSYLKNELLINDEHYQKLNDQLSSATISFYINNKNSNVIFSKNLNTRYFKHYQANSGLGKFDAFSYQLTGDNGKFLSNLLLVKKPDKAVDTTLLAN